MRARGRGTHGIAMLPSNDAAHSPSVPEARVGEVLDGKYRIDEVLGVGGMGVVVAARRLELGTSVAVKLMLADAASDVAAVARFSREARAMVQLKGANSVRVFDVGKTDRGVPYMVMELLEGEDLGELLDRTTAPLPISQSVDWILEACMGVAEAHAMGIIHRDLKPRNLFLARQPDGSVVLKVLDFGLAKSITAMSADERALTRTTALMGSPVYMSPEQMKASREVDGGTDIWSLGVCLYELLTRTTPFEAATVPEVCALVIAASPKPPEVHRPDIPPRLSATIMRCLEKDRARRFRDVGELAAALGEITGSGRHSAARVQNVLSSSAVRRIDSLRSEPPVRIEPSAPTTTLALTSAPAARTVVMSVPPRAGAPRGAFIALVAAAFLALALVAIGVFLYTRAPRVAAVTPPAPPPSAVVVVEPAPPALLIDEATAGTRPATTTGSSAPASAASSGTAGAGAKARPRAPAPPSRSAGSTSAPKAEPKPEPPPPPPPPPPITTAF